ncbi:proline dehydrogenase family protein [Candidatus Amarobacter glycogenicus]|uniref:proline dehydrogenase family protein n=1 Tax=Candidatus Amarobacter glycogenicus TaxID=3140699 RepID=UPI002A16FC89|nr:proline dehydrogenase family protein [Dehalococcoidia bacterium]
MFKPTGISRTELLRMREQRSGAYGRRTSGMATGGTTHWSACAVAHDADARLLVDAEESWLQPAIDGLVQEMMEPTTAKKAVVFNTVQLYRHDRLAFLRESLAGCGEGLLPGHEAGAQGVHGKGT